MATYKTIYSFNVLDAIKEGKQVRVLDKEKDTVLNASEMRGSYLVEAIYEDSNRFEFWEVEK